MNVGGIFRDTRDWYLSVRGYASSSLINFALKYAGREILDVGCATGEYCRALNRRAYRCVGIDINLRYISRARSQGLSVCVMDSAMLGVRDKCFDTVLLFEHLEHVEDPELCLKEAKRVAKKNILITVPNCTQQVVLARCGLTYEHMLERDHRNFFSKKEMEKLLSKDFSKFIVEEKEPINPVPLLGPPVCRKVLAVLYKLKLIKGGVYYRLFAVIDLE